MTEETGHMTNMTRLKGAVRIALQGAASAKPALAGYGLEIAYRYSLPCQLAPTAKHKFAVEGA